MSRAGLYGSLFAAVAAGLLGYCSGTKRGAPYVNAKSPVTVEFTCEGGDSKIGLTANGKPAWLVETDQKKLRWEVPENVTIDAISAKSGELPVEPETEDEGRTRGKPYKSKVKDGVEPGDTRYPYAIALTCQPSGSGQQPVKLIIDPEMIVR
jgi:hypothetical protein